MPKKMKLDLNDLKVNSFVTTLEKEEKGRVKGGWEPTMYWKEVTCSPDVC